LVLGAISDINMATDGHSKQLSIIRVAP